MSGADAIDPDSDGDGILDGALNVRLLATSELYALSAVYAGVEPEDLATAGAAADLRLVREEIVKRELAFLSQWASPTALRMWGWRL